MMPRISMLALLLFASPTLAQQSAPKTDSSRAKAVEETISAAPSWFTDGGLDDEDYVLGAGTAVSRDLQLAVEKAQLAGRNQIASRLELRFSSLAKRFQEEAGSADDPQLMDQMTSAYKSVVTTSMGGTKARQQEVRGERGLYRVYVLMELPVGTAGATMLAKIKENERMYTRLRATRAYAELEKESVKEDDRKKAPVPPSSR